MTSWTPFVFLGCFVLLLAAVTVIRLRNAAGMLHWLTDTMDGSTRWVYGVSLVPGLALTIFTVIDGLEPPQALLLGLVCAFGTAMALLGAFGMEGVLLEKESEAAHRIAEQRPPPSSPLGRVIAIILGSLIAAASVIPPWLA